MQKSDNLVKNIKLKIVQIGLFARLKYIQKKHLKRCIIKNGAASKLVRAAKATAQTFGSRFARSPEPNFAWLCRQTYFSS